MKLAIWLIGLTALAMIVNYAVIRQLIQKQAARIDTLECAVFLVLWNAALCLCATLAGKVY